MKNKKANYNLLAVVLLNASFTLSSYVQSAGFKAQDKTYLTRINKNYELQLDFLDGFKDNYLNEKILRATAIKFSASTELKSIGQTHYQQPIWALYIDFERAKINKPAILINCAHHANEILSTEFCYSILKEILTGTAPEAQLARQNYRWVIVPLVNPDGSQNFWQLSTLAGRKNGNPIWDKPQWKPENGVDINRNYPIGWGKSPKGSSSKPNEWNFRGLAPASEPETQAMMNLVEQEQFIISLSFHTSATKILVPYSIEQFKNPVPEIATSLAQILAKNADSSKKDQPYQVVKNLYPVDGTDQDWFYFKNGTVALLIEGPYQWADYFKQAIPAVNGFLLGFRALVKQLAQWPVLHLQLTQQGQGIQQEITLNEITYLNHEVRQTQKGTGEFWQILPKLNKLNMTAGGENKQLDLKPGVNFVKWELGRQ